MPFALVPGVDPNRARIHFLGHKATGQRQLGNWAIVSVLGLLWIKGGMITCAILLTLSAVGIWFMLPLGVILLTAVGAIFFLPQAILAFLNFDFSQVSGTEDILIAVSELNCLPLFFAGAILYSLWRRIVFRRL